MHKPIKPTKLRLTTETITVLASEKLAAVAGGQKPPHPRTDEESICWCYTSV